MLDNFWIDGESAADHGIVCQNIITFDAAEPEVETIKVVGRSGKLVYWDGSFKNVSGRAKCYCLDKNVSDVLVTVNRWLLSSPYYRRIETLHDDQFFRLGRLVRGAAWGVRLGVLNPFELEFDCKPQKFYKDGENEITLTAAATLHNPSTCDALPVITVHGSGTGTLTVNGSTLTLTDCNEIILDCEEKEAVKNNQSANSSVSGTYPTLGIESSVSWTGGITSVTIKPRWWTL